MKKTELSGMLEKGPVLVGEFRGGVTDGMDITDENSGKVRHVAFVKLNLEVGVFPSVQAIAVSIGGDRGKGVEEFQNAAKLLPTVKRGQTVAVDLTSYAWGKRGLSARGSAFAVVE